jgi:RimJ/RimL family protein N-acetyltransferase
MRSVRRNMINQHTITSAEHAQWVSRVCASTRQRFWVVYCGQVPIGSVYVTDINRRTYSCRWGFYIASASFRGKGFGKIILIKLCCIVFLRWKLLRMHTVALEHNAVAHNLYGQLKSRQRRLTLYRGHRNVIWYEFTKTSALGNLSELNNVRTKK